MKIGCFSQICALIDKNLAIPSIFHSLSLEASLVMKRLTFPTCFSWCMGLQVLNEGCDCFCCFPTYRLPEKMRKQSVELTKKDFGNSCNLKAVQQMLLLDKENQTAQGQFKWVGENPCFRGLLQFQVVIQHLRSGS